MYKAIASFVSFVLFKNPKGLLSVISATDLSTDGLNACSFVALFGPETKLLMADPTLAPVFPFPLKKLAPFESAPPIASFKIPDNPACAEDETSPSLFN